MSSSTTQLSLAHFDVPGPKARRRIRIASLVGAILLLAGIAYTIHRFAVTGQLDPAKWEPFTYTKIQLALLEGVLSTVRVAAMSAVLTLFVGFVIGLAQLSRHRWVAIPAKIIMEMFRGVPVLLLIFIMFYIGAGVLSPYWSVVLGVTGYNGMVVAEIVRTGIIAVPRGQREAASSIGLTQPQVMRIVLIPIALRAMAPALVSQMVVMLKDSALGFLVTYTDLLYVVNNIGRDYNNLLPTFMVGAGMYVLLNLAISAIAKLLRMRRSMHVTTSPTPAQA